MQTFIVLLNNQGTTIPLSKVPCYFPLYICKHGDFGQGMSIADMHTGNTGYVGISQGADLFVVGDCFVLSLHTTQE